MSENESKKTKAKAGPVAADALRAYIERIERVEDEIKAYNGDKKEIYAQAKGNGFDTDAMKKVVALRRMKPADREELDALVGVYREAVGI